MTASASLFALLAQPEVTDTTFAVLTSHPSFASVLQAALLEQVAALASSYDTLSAPSPTGKDVLRVLSRLASASTPVNPETLALFAAAFQRHHAGEVGRIMERYADELQPLLPAWIGELCTALGGQAGSEEELVRTCILHLSVARSSTTLSETYAQDARVLPLLSTLYGRLMPSKEAGSKRTANLKLDVLQTAFTLLDVGYLAPLASAKTDKDSQTFLVELDRALGPLLPQKQSGGRTFGSATLVEDLETFFEISSKLPLSGKRLKDRLETLRGTSMDLNDFFGVAPAPVPEVEQDRKGKGKAAQAEDPAELDQAVAHVLSILPDSSSQTVRLLFKHRSLAGPGGELPQPERVIELLLEDNLPPDLLEQRALLPVAAAAPAVRNERSSFAREMGSGAIQVGKARMEVPSENFMTAEMKAAIIARAEAESEDEFDALEADGEEGGGEAFIEQLDEEDYAAVKDGDESSDDETRLARRQRPQPTSAAGSGASTPVPHANGADGGLTPQLQQVLEHHFLSDPTVFDRSALVRRSRARQALREQTGWADEQLEGWKVMLDRDPRRIANLREKEAIKRPLNHQAPVQNGSHGQEGQNGGRGRGRGGRGGSGGGERGRGGANRGRGDGGRAAHQRRQRGSDKKMARMGAP